MKTPLILITPGWLLLGAVTSLAGSRSGGTVKIPADTLSTGGGRSSAGTGAGAVTITSSLGGILSTGTASTPAIRNQQGYIPQILPFTAPPLTGFALWASTSIPSGKDATFNGDWNNDGIPNGVAYVFGNTPLSPIGGQIAGRGKIAAPPSIPADVNVYLDWGNRSLSPWINILKWENGNAPVFVYPTSTTIADGFVIDNGNTSPWFYRYRVTQR